MGWCGLVAPNLATPLGSCKFLVCGLVAHNKLATLTSYLLRKDGTQPNLTQQEFGDQRNCSGGR
jgi:hypothetical protein